MPNPIRPPGPGGPDALAVVFERHRPAMRRMAARMLWGTGSDPDDAVQDVYVRLHRAVARGTVTHVERALLLRLVHNRCVDELRALRRRPTAELLEHGDGEPAGGGGGRAEPLAGALRREELGLLVADVRRLPERQRQALVRSAVDGLSHEQVAASLQTTVPTAKSLVLRARDNLRRTAAARQLPCSEIRGDLERATACGVRASERARRHLWSCAACRVHVTALRAKRRAAAVVPGWLGLLGADQSPAVGGAAPKALVGVCCAVSLAGGAAALETKLPAAVEPPVAAVRSAQLPRQAPPPPRALRPPATPPGDPGPTGGGSDGGAGGLAVEVPDLGLGVALDRGRAGRDGALDAPELLDGELDLRRAERLVQAVAAACTDQRHDVLAAREHPADRHLCDRRALGLGDLAQRVDERMIPEEVVLAEARAQPAEVALAELALGRPVPGKQPARDHAVGRDGDAQLPAGRKDLLLETTRQQRVLDLHVAVRVHGGSLPHGLGADL